jgi:hypothetical protein
MTKMSKDCTDCKYCDGFSYDDGTPICTYEDPAGGEGYEYCPFNDGAPTKNNGVKIEIDSGFMSDYIRHTMLNTIHGCAYQIASKEIKSLVDEDMKKSIHNEMSTQVATVVSGAIDEFMDKEITVGGGWREPERKLTRTEYLSELIEKELESRFKSDSLKSYAEREVKSAIDKYERKLRDEINAGIKTYFDEATRRILTENVVSMLMCNDTYQKLSNSMQKFLPESKA